MKYIPYILFISFLLQGCAGTRNSYTSLLEDNNEMAVIRVSKGESVELLAIGNGFPGWWGYYPGVISSAPQIASVDCNEARSAVPFRKPGTVFGGEVCTLTAHEKGTTTLYFGNKFGLDQENYREKIDVIIVED